MSKPEHTYCFYMNNGEHIMVDADLMVDCTEHYELYKDNNLKPFMQVFKASVMAWEINR